jgi:hypothetical protein
MPCRILHSSKVGLAILGRLKFVYCVYLRLRVDFLSMPSPFPSEESRERRAIRLADAAEQRQIQASNNGTTDGRPVEGPRDRPHTSPRDRPSTNPHTSPNGGGAQSPASSVATSTVVSPDPNGCAICMNTISGDDAYECHVCFKKYHRPCIQEWFRRSVMCPLCRARQTNVSPELLPPRRSGAPPSAAAMGTLMAMLGMSGALETSDVFGGEEPNATEPRRFHFVVRPPGTGGRGRARQGDPRQGDPRQGDPRQGDPRQGNPRNYHQHSSPLQSDSDEESFESFLDNLDMTAMAVCFLAVFVVVCVALHALDTSFFHLAAEFLRSVAVVFGMVLLSVMVVALVFCLYAVWTSLELTYVVGTWDGWVVGGMTVLAVLVCVGLAAKTFVDGGVVSDTDGVSGASAVVCCPEPSDSVSSW